MRGAIVFLIFFFAALLITLAYPVMMPGSSIYAALGFPNPIGYLVLGIEATILITAVFNGVFYGIIAWIAYTVAHKTHIIK